MRVKGPGFSEVLHPLAWEDFVVDHWERNPLHLSRQTPGYYDGLFSVADLDALLAQGRPRYPQLRVVRKDEPMAAQCLLDAAWLHPPMPSHIADAKMSPLYAAYSEGYTIIVELQKLWRPVTALCREMEEALHHRTTAELYLTPAGAQGFELHYDHHEVFLLQIEGAKHWRVYDPITVLPVTGGRPARDEATRDAIVDATLEAGDLLYIPRGFLHEGSTSDSHSLHIGFGVSVHRWSDLFHELLRSVTEQDVRFRESLPLGFLDPQLDVGQLRDRAQELLTALLDDPAGADRALDRLRTRFVSELGPVPDGHFADLNLLSSMTIDSKVQKRAGSLCVVTSDDEAATIRFPGGHVRAKARVRPVLDRICAATDPFAVGSLPDILDADGKLVLVRRLVREGLLHIVAP